VTFRLADGVRVKGELTAWDDDGIDGSFGRRQWTELHHEDIWPLHMKLMDSKAPDAWVDLGRILLLVSLDQPLAAKRSERAFRQAVRLDPATEEAIADARLEVADVKLQREEAAAAAKAERLKTLSPEGGPWRPRKWPALTPEESADAVQAMRDDATRILERAGMQIAPVETDFFLFYSDMPRRHAQKWVRELDIMYKKLAGQFDLAEGENIFWGKAVIFVFNSRDRFRLVEAESFGHLAPEWADGLCHPLGPKVFVNFYRQPEDERFAAVLVHETVHGFMHRYRTPMRLPIWANEGFADYLASVLFRNSPVDQLRRRTGLRYIRRNGDVNAVLDMSYMDGSWPGPKEIGYSVGYLMVELMIRDRPQEFGAWVDAVKDGKEWEQALIDEFGVTRQQLVDRFVAWYKVND
jgi:hypothetical protein